MNVLRRIRRAPAPAIVVVLTIGLAVGVVSTMFTAFNAVLLRELPVRDPERLVRVVAVNPRGETTETLLAEDFLALRDASPRIELAAFTQSSAAVRDGDRLAVTGVEHVSEGFFDVAGARMVRGFLPRMGERGVVVSERFANASQLLINDVPHSVTGVVAFRGTNFAIPIDVWMPNDLAAAKRSNVRVIGRLGGTMNQADAQKILSAALPDKVRTATVRVGSERAMLIAPEMPGMVRIALILAGVLGGLAVLVAASNVAGVLFARVATRRRELAVRSALGATSGTLVRQIIGETLPLAIPAAILSHVIAFYGSRVYKALMPPQSVPPVDFAPDSRVALFGLLMALLATFFAGAAAAFQARRTTAGDLVTRGGSERTPRALGAIVVAQLAFATVVLLASALLVQTARAYRAIDPGFESAKQLIVPVVLETRDLAWLRDLAERVRQSPGVTHVAIARNTPLARQQHVVIERDGEKLDGLMTLIEGDYFGSISLPILRGRALEPGDRENVAVVNEKLGVGVGGRVTIDGRVYSVVGIARDARFNALAESPRPFVWTPIHDATLKSARLQIRTTHDLAATARDVNALLAAAELPPTAVPLEDSLRLDRGLATTASIIAGALGALTLLLAAIGLYGVVSARVTQRRRELAVRSALGATRGDLATLVAGGSFRLFLMGAIAGALLAIPVVRALASLLFGVEAFDPTSWGAVPVAVAIAVALATILPVRRALRTAPAELLRES